MACLKENLAVRYSLEVVGATGLAKQFVSEIFATIESGPRVAAVPLFLFGTEDRLPDIFHRVVQLLNVGVCGQ
jgi:hypothetical protein